jgi:hypothetical protein
VFFWKATADFRVKQLVALSPVYVEIMKFPYSRFAVAAIALAAASAHSQQVSKDALAPETPAKTNAPAASTDTHSFVRLQGTDLHVGDLPPVTFHGFASQGFLVSDTYNYLGDTTDGSARFSEFGVNASMNPLPRTRIAMQGFSYCVGNAGEYDPVLDYCLAEYSFCDAFGVRGGRVRRQEGFYNHVVDLDMARTWVLLPQGMYPAKWRDMYSSLDGGEAFGSVSLSKFGSLSYELYTGYQRPQLNGGLAAQKANTPPYSRLVDVNSPWLSGGQLWWDTPVSGLRLGAAINYDEDVTFKTANGNTTVGSPFVQHYSVEYLWKSWTVQAEYFTYCIDYDISKNGAHVRDVHIQPDSWYASAAYRFNRWFEAGTYYTEYWQDIRYRDGDSYSSATGNPASDMCQRDVALALRFDPTSWWILKVEGHMIQGTAQLYDVKANPIRDNGWWPMLALKSTFTF